MISLPRPPGWADIADITLGNGQATLTEAKGAALSTPFDTGFFP
jgi:hypothetical protein